MLEAVAATIAPSTCCGSFNSFRPYLCVPLRSRIGCSVRSRSSPSESGRSLTTAKNRLLARGARAGGRRWRSKCPHPLPPVRRVAPVSAPCSRRCGDAVLAPILTPSACGTARRKHYRRRGGRRARTRAATAIPVWGRSRRCIPVGATRPAHRVRGVSRSGRRRRALDLGSRRRIRRGTV